MSVWVGHDFAEDSNVKFLIKGNSLQDASQYNNQTRLYLTSVPVAIDKSQGFEGALSFTGTDNQALLATTAYSVFPNGYTGNFTIDLRFKLNTISGNGTLFTTTPGLGSQDGIFMGFAGSQLRAWASTKGTGAFDLMNSVVIYSGLTVNTWYHFALTRSGTTYRFFINGVLRYTKTMSAEVRVANLILGMLNNDWNLNGYIEQAMVYGTARWTSTFTPPSVPYSYYGLSNAEAKDIYVGYQGVNKKVIQAYVGYGGSNRLVYAASLYEKTDIIGTFTQVTNSPVGLAYYISNFVNDGWAFDSLARLDGVSLNSSGNWSISWKFSMSSIDSSSFTDGGIDLKIREYAASTSPSYDILTFSLRCQSSPTPVTGQPKIYIKYRSGSVDTMSSNSIPYTEYDDIELTITKVGNVYSVYKGSELYVSYSTSYSYTNAQVFIGGYCKNSLAKPTMYHGDISFS